MDLQFPLPRKPFPDRADRPASNAEASTLGFDVELRELIDGGPCRGQSSNEGKPYGMAAVLNDEGMPTKLGPIGVEIRVGGRGSRAAGNISIAA